MLDFFAMCYMPLRLFSVSHVSLFIFVHMSQNFFNDLSSQFTISLLNFGNYAVKHMYRILKFQLFCFSVLEFPFIFYSL